MTEIEELRRRLALAERVCALLGVISIKGESDQEKAVQAAWSEWYRAGGARVPRPPDDEVLRLAARQDIRRNVTLSRIEQEQRGETP